MSSSNPRFMSHVKRWALGGLVLVAIVSAATMNRWLPEVRRLVGMSPVVSDHGNHEEGHLPTDKCDAHEHEELGSGDEEADHESHDCDEAATVRLTAAAQGNVGVRLAKVELGPFERTISVPAMVVERPGRSHVQVAAPLTGVVSRIYPLQGEAVEAGQPLFDLRLTHEEVVEAQAALLQTVEELDVLQREIDRLKKIVASGAVAGKTLLEREYERQKLEATLRSQRQRLLLHGLTQSQIDGIVTDRSLLGKVTVFVPLRKDSAPGSAEAPLLQVEKLKVDPGQHVQVGEPLCILADYSDLFIEGKAFEQDVPALENAANQKWRVSAVVAGADGRRQTVPNLEIFSLANTVAPESRAFVFHVRLPNTLVRDSRTPDGHRFCSWRFKLGQRLELLVPVERWTERIVLPCDAVVRDGAESYVFEKNDGHFDRRAVRVEHRDQYSVVLANDGAVAPGKTVVVAGAYQIHLALKNKSAAAPDPHAGHNH